MSSLKTDGVARRGVSSAQGADTAGSLRPVHRDADAAVRVVIIGQPHEEPLAVRGYIVFGEVVCPHATRVARVCGVRLAGCGSAEVKQQHGRQTGPNGSTETITPSGCSKNSSRPSPRHRGMNPPLRDTRRPDVSPSTAAT